MNQHALEQTPQPENDEPLHEDAGRIHDRDKAEEMAYAGKDHRSNAAYLRLSRQIRERNADKDDTSRKSMKEVASEIDKLRTSHGAEYSDFDPFFNYDSSNRDPKGHPTTAFAAKMFLKANDAIGKELEHADKHDAAAETLETYAAQLYDHPPSQDFLSEFNGGYSIEAHDLHRAVVEAARFRRDAEDSDNALDALLERVQEETDDHGYNPTISALHRATYEIVKHNPDTQLRYSELQNDDETTIGDLKNFYHELSLEQAAGYREQATRRETLVNAVMSGEAETYSKEV